MGHEQRSTGEVLRQMSLSWPLFHIPALKGELKVLGSFSGDVFIPSSISFFLCKGTSEPQTAVVCGVTLFSPPVPPLCTFQTLLSERCLIDDHSPICFLSSRKLLKSLIPDDFLMCSFCVCAYFLSHPPLFSFIQGLGCTQALRLPTQTRITITYEHFISPD